MLKRIALVNGFCPAIRNERRSGSAKGSKLTCGSAAGWALCRQRRPSRPAHCCRWPMGQIAAFAARIADIRCKSKTLLWFRLQRNGLRWTFPASPSLRTMQGTSAILFIRSCLTSNSGGVGKTWGAHDFQGLRKPPKILAKPDIGLRYRVSSEIVTSTVPSGCFLTVSVFVADSLPPPLTAT